MLDDQTMHGALTMTAMPSIIVLIVCKVVVAGPPDQNADLTGAQNLEWATVNSMMLCRRQEVAMYDPSVEAGADPEPFSPQACTRSAVVLATQWNLQNRASSYRVWHVACPTPIHQSPDPSSPIVGWTLPDCGHRETVICDVDSVI